MAPRTTRRASLTALACAVIGAWPFAASAQMEAGYRTVTIATASPGGNYFLTGNAICRALHRQGLYLDSGDVTLMNCAAMSTPGSIQNVDLLRSRMADVALIQSDWHYHAYTGSDRFTGRKLEQMRSLVSLNREAFQVFAGRGMQIERWGDLKGKKVNLGPKGTTSDSMFQELFKVHGLDETWLTQALRLPATAHVQEMCEGNIEALAQVSGVPNSGLTDAARRCGATLVRLDTEEIKKMVRDRPYYTPLTIAKGTYNGQIEDVPTFGVVATLVANADISDAVAYSLVRAIFEAMPELQAQVPVLRGLKPEDMVSGGMSAPLHPGAERYFRERKLIRSQAETTAAALATMTAGMAGSAAPAIAPPAPTIPEPVALAPTPALPVAAKPAPTSIRAKARPKNGSR